MPDASAAQRSPKRRLRACVEAWPEAETMGYDPRCCRFPKSCSADIYDEQYVSEADLEPSASTEGARIVSVSALEPEAWDRAADPDLPDGVVAFQDASGMWWRYPLAEFPSGASADLGAEADRG